MKPRIFIGSSSENIEIAEAISTNLSAISFPEVWDQCMSTLSQSTLTNLVDAIQNYDFAIFIFGAEDTTIIREDKFLTVRDNVIFETGLFMGKLGIDHVFFVKPQSKEIHLPSDLLGITYGVYDVEHPNKMAALRPFCNQVKDQIRSNYMPTFQKDGIFGLNVLNSDLVNITGNSTRMGDIVYGLYAKTSPTQEITVTIFNESNCPNENVWYITLGNIQGWHKSIYNNNIQEFTLLPDMLGILEIYFVGTGLASLTVTLKGQIKPILEKKIYWQ